MKKNIAKLLLMALFSIFSKGAAQGPSSIYDLEYTSIEGETVSLKSFEGKYILFVNVASECGFTSQYEDLETLAEQYKEQLIVIGFPCNQFGGQEPGTSKEIQTFCKTSYGADFPLSEKIEVKGDNQHPIYKWLTDKTLNEQSSSSVKWNFQKYLINRAGELEKIINPGTAPDAPEIIDWINKEA